MALDFDTDDLKGVLDVRLSPSLPYALTSLRSLANAHTALAPKPHHPPNRNVPLLKHTPPLPLIQLHMAKLSRK